MSKVGCGVNVWEMPGNVVISRDIANLRKKMCDNSFKRNCQTFSFFGRNYSLSDDMSIDGKMRYNGALQSVINNIEDRKSPLLWGFSCNGQRYKVLQKYNLERKIIN